MNTTLAEALPSEVERVIRLAKLYMSVPFGYLSANMMLSDVRAAQQAIQCGDIVEMLRLYESLKEWKDG